MLRVSKSKKLLATIGIVQEEIIPNSFFATQPAEQTIKKLVQEIRAIAETFSEITIEATLVKVMSQIDEPSAIAMSGLDLVIEYCQQNEIHLGITTMDIELTTIKQLNSHHLAEAFSFIATSDNCQYLKPQAELVQQFSRAVQVPISEIAIVGDSWSDMQLGINAGVKQLFYLADTQKNYSGNVRVIWSLEELISII